MKALDEKKIIWYTMIQALLLINFISHWSKKKISYMKKERENEQERRYQSYNRYRKIQQVSSKSKWMEHWTLASSYKLYDSIDFI